MATVTYYSIMAIVFVVRCMPLTMVARIGRFLGGVVYLLDGRHRRRAIENLRRVFGTEWEEAAVAATAKENFRRLGENYACAIKASYMTDAQLRAHVEVRGEENYFNAVESSGKKNVVFAIGHFGNFELYARLGALIGFTNGATTYRALKNAGASRVMEELRARSDTTFFERRKDADELKVRLRDGGLSLGLLSDHYAGRAGIDCEFLGHTCASTPAPVVLAMRYDASLISAICYRVGLGRWLLEISPQIPLKSEQGVRSVAEVTLDVQDRLSEAVRRDPANWFWVHNRWRTSVRRERSASGDSLATSSSKETATGTAKKKSSET